MILGLFCQTMLVLTDLKYPLGLEGTHTYKEITVLSQALLRYLLHHKSKETLSLKNRYAIAATAKRLPHPGQRGMKMLE